MVVLLGKVLAAAFGCISSCVYDGPPTLRALVGVEQGNAHSPLRSLLQLSELPLLQSVPKQFPLWGPFEGLLIGREGEKVLAGLTITGWGRKDNFGNQSIFKETQV